MNPDCDYDYCPDDQNIEIIEEIILVNNTAGFVEKAIHNRGNGSGSGRVCSGSGSGNCQNDTQRPTSSGTGGNSKRKRTSVAKQEELDAVFVDVLEEVGKVLLLKSQTPSVRQQKKDALKAMQNSLLVNYGLEYTGDQVLKKLNNLKTIVKEKTDSKKTGNVKIILNKPQQKFFDLLGGIENPSVGNVSYGAAAGSKRQKREEHPPIEDEDDEDNESDTSFNNESPMHQPEPQTPKRMPRIMKSDTRSITQQTVYEEQIKLIKDQQDYTALLKANQEERHEKEMELLALKKEIAVLKIKMLKDNIYV